MSLIEQLGGYEKAKAFLNATSFTIDELIMMQRSGLRTQHVEKALLEYRRQHNTYEAGDKVVVLTNALGNKYTWIVKSIDGIMVEISQLGQPNEWVHYSEIAHTTPEEIKAGKRLEVNQ
ncbi:hypothetical protein [Acinetobacter lwoffii]|uniref:hypothetical protein n=1 Tax=Acinetobacter lwoffii TaxID=28090 RepID=UPI0032B3318F